MSEREWIALPVSEFVAELASDAPVPGGGSASALAGAMGAALVAMVARLSIGRPAYAADEAQLREILADAEALRGQLLALADRDAEAYASLVAARRLPKDPPEERSARAVAIQAAAAAATRIPLETARLARDALQLAARIAPIGNRNAASDAGVAAVLAAAAARGAALNVRINLPGLAADEALRANAVRELEAMEADLAGSERRVLADVAARM